MHTIIFGISSNDTDRQVKVHDAVEELRTLFPNLQTSESYFSPCYNNAGPEYLALVARGESELPLERLEVFVKAFEWNLGRDRSTESNGVVAIDIDIVCYDNEILKTCDYENPGFKQALNSLT